MHRKLHMLLPVGGHVELDETPWQAISHELAEESGYTLGELNILQPVSRLKALSTVALHPAPLAMNTHDIPTKHFHTDIQYGFIASGEPSGKPDENESADLRWLTSDELDQLPNTEIYETTRETYRFLLDEALPQWDKIATNLFQLEFPKDLPH